VADLKLALALAVLVAVVPEAAFAQGSGDAAAAEALYREGVSEMEGGNFGSACSKLEESFRLDPATGALLTLAACFERSGKIASAWARYLDVESRARTAGEKDRETVAHAKSEELAPRLPRLRIQLAPGVSSIAGLEVRRDKTLMSVATLSSPLPVDPGIHVVEITAPGHMPAKKEVTVSEGRTEVVAFDSLTPADATAPVPNPALPPTLPPEPSGGLGGVQIGGIVVGSLGIAAVGVGFGFGAVASGAKSDLDALEYDPDEGTCASGTPAACVDAYDRTSGPATISTILVISGSVLAGAGLVMLLVGDASSSDDAKVELVPGFGGAVLRGSL